MRDCYFHAIEIKSRRGKELLLLLSVYSGMNEIMWKSSKTQTHTPDDDDEVEARSQQQKTHKLNLGTCLSLFIMEKTPFHPHPFSSLISFISKNVYTFIISTLESERDY